MSKSQSNSIIFLIFLILSLIIFITFFNRYFGFSYQKEILEIKKIDLVNNIIKLFKAFTLLSLEYSSQQTLREGACVGGAITTGSWICNSPTPPDVQKTIECHEEYIKYYLSLYLEKFNISIPFDFEISFDGKCKELVEEEKIFSGKYDEGYFFMKCFNISINVFSKNLGGNENFNVSLFLTKNRFWYLFRNFYEWAQENVYGKCVCKCTSSCSDCNCVEKCAELALKNLQERFDKHVICEIKERCCYREIGKKCLPPSNCILWKDPPKCKMGMCGGPVCEILKEKKELCKPEIKYDKLECYSVIWRENKIASSHTYRCTDTKYFIPSDRGPIPLIFEVNAVANFKDNDACKRLVKCDCPEDAKKCEECKQTGCTKCLPK